MIYVISYDITENHLRRKVSKILGSYGNRVQKSVFELDLNAKQLLYVINLIQQYIEPNDSIRCYPLCEQCIVKAKSYNTEPLTRDQTYYMT